MFFEFFVCFLFTLDCFFCCAEGIFSSLMFPLAIIDLSSQANGVLFRNSFPLPIIQGPIIFSSSNFSIASLKWKSLINIELNFVQGNAYKSNFILLTCGLPVVPTLLRWYLFSRVCFFPFVKYQRPVVMSTHVWVFCFLIDLPVCFCVCAILIFIIISLQWLLRPGMAIPPALLFLLRIAGLPGLFYGSVWILWLLFLFFPKKVLGILIGITLNLLIAFGVMFIFTILILPMHDPRRSFNPYCLAGFNLDL